MNDRGGYRLEDEIKVTKFCSPGIVWRMVKDDGSIFSLERVFIWIVPRTAWGWNIARVVNRTKLNIK